MSFLSDGFRLSGTLHLPDADQPPLIVGSHGLLSSSRSPKQMDMAGRCCDCGMAFFRFDHRGCGDSDGDETDVTDFGGRCRDMKCAVDFLRNQFDPNSKIGLFGSSFGGAVCLSAASPVGADALVTVAAPLSRATLIEASGGVVPAGLTAKQALSPRFNFDLTEQLAAIHHVLIFHGEKDTIVPVSNARTLYEKAARPKKLVIQDNGDHVMSLARHQETFMMEAAEWFSAYLKRFDSR